jgi:glycosyltransferase involved in cell wall biosynthesis
MNMGAIHESNKSAVLLIDSGGLSHYTCYLASGLAKYRQVILYGFSNHQYILTGAVKEKRIKFFNIGEKLPKGTSIISSIIFPFLLFRPLLKGLTNEKYGIVHIQGQSWLFFLFIPLLRLKRKPIFWTMHDVDIRPSNPGIRGKLESLQVRLLCQNNILRKHVNVIIVHGSKLRDKLISKGVDKNKIHVMPHFDYKYLLDSKSYPDSLDEYVLLFGKIKPYKGIDIFLKASRIARKKIGNKFKIIIAGKGDMSYLDPVFRNNNAEYIQVLNKYIPDSEISNLFRNAKFLVLPYTDASQSGIIPLAYTFSKPVIVSNVGSIAEYVDEGITGWIFEVGDIDQLANRIIEMYQNTEKCIEMGQNAYKKMIKEMSVEKCCAFLNELYQQYRS